MSESLLNRRERAFEAVFFARLDEELIAKMRAKRAREAALGELATSLGVADPELLQHILDQGVDATTLQALSVVPLVLTAWANGDVTDDERAAVLRAAAESGVTEESGARHLLDAWLDEVPGEDLEATWCEYVHSVLEKLEPGKATEVSERVLRRCRDVAKASGGFLGIGEISRKEHAVLDRVAEALSL
jgi:tellurite resistance protein